MNMARTFSADLTPLETEEQAALIKALDQLPYHGMRVGDFAVASQNGGRTSSIMQARKLRSEGMRKGFPDLALYIPAGGFHGLFIELKRAKRSLSKVAPEQKVWQERLNSMGYKSVICYGAQEALDTVTRYLGGRL